VSYLKRLVAGFSSRRPGFASRQSMWTLWQTKWHWGRFSPSTSVSLDNHHSTNFSIIIIIRGCHNRPTGGRSAEWTQLDYNPLPPVFKSLLSGVSIDHERTYKFCKKLLLYVECYQHLLKTFFLRYVDTSPYRYHWWIAIILNGPFHYSISDKPEKRK
jgi:hypothetical protein